MIIIKYIFIGAGTFCVLGLALLGLIVIGPVILGIIVVLGQILVYAAVIIIPLGIMGWIINYIYKRCIKAKEAV